MEQIGCIRFMSRKALEEPETFVSWYMVYQHTTYVFLGSTVQSENALKFREQGLPNKGEDCPQPRMRSILLNRPPNGL
jgi:hypothetical protein